MKGCGSDQPAPKLEADEEGAKSDGLYEEISHLADRASKARNCPEDGRAWNSAESRSAQILKVNNPVDSRQEPDDVFASSPR